MDVAKARIFIINPESEIYQLNSIYKWTYKKLNQTVSLIFPPVATISKNIEYNDKNFWNDNEKKKQGDIDSLLKEVEDGVNIWVLREC